MGKFTARTPSWTSTEYSTFWEELLLALRTPDGPAPGLPLESREGAFDISPAPKAHPEEKGAPTFREPKRTRFLGQDAGWVDPKVWREIDLPRHSIHLQVVRCFRQGQSDAQNKTRKTKGVGEALSLLSPLEKRRGAILREPDDKELEELGACLAEEACRWALDGPSSALASLSELDRELDPARRTSDADFCLELYILHYCAFVKAAFRFDLAATYLLMGMQKAAGYTAAGVLKARGVEPEDEMSLAGRCSDAFVEYNEALKSESVEPLLDFGALAVSRVFGHEHKDPGLALLLATVFQSAVEKCSEMLTQGLKAMELHPRWYGEGE